MSADDLVDPAVSAEDLALEVALRMSPAERFEWLVTTVEDLLPLLGTARPGPDAELEDPGQTSK